MNWIAANLFVLPFRFALISPATLAAGSSALFGAAEAEAKTQAYAALHPLSPGAVEPSRSR
jgi:hypothetical protein